VDLEAFRKEPTRAHVPTCPECGAWIRQHVLWFDELYISHADYQWQRVQEAMEQCELLLFVGTSLSVGVTDHMLSRAMARRVPIFNIDPGGLERPGVILLREQSERALPELARLLR
jgi:NAD-dependent deacetylase